MRVIDRLSPSSAGSAVEQVDGEVTSVCSIQLPQSSSAMPTPISFGTKASVNSWIWVIDWNSEIVKPMTSEVTRIGAESLSATSMVCSAMLDDGGVGHGAPTRSSRRGT